MTYAECFAGIGGWSVGLRDSGWFLEWQCEFDPKLQRFLADRFGVPVHGDVRTLTQADLESVDVLIGSPPCQPFSMAGSRSGTSDERHLYPSFIDAVRAFKPRWVLMEQVPAILSPERDKSTGRLTGPAPIGAYVGGLAALGYLGCYHCIPACALGAPHRRDRIWIIAHANSNSTRREEQHSPGQSDWPGIGSRLPSPENAAYAEGICAGRLPIREAPRLSGSKLSHSINGDVENAIGDRWKQTGPRESRPSSEIASNDSDSEDQRCGKAGKFRERQKEWASSDCQIRIDGDSSSQGLPDWAGGQVGQPSPLTEFERPSGREIERDFCGVAHGVSNRVAKIKGLGNAVVTLIPKIIGQAINEVERGDLK